MKGAQIICVATPGAFFVVYSIQAKNKLTSAVDYSSHDIEHTTSRTEVSDEMLSAIPKRRHEFHFITYLLKKFELGFFCNFGNHYSYKIWHSRTEHSELSV